MSSSSSVFIRLACACVLACAMVTTGLGDLREVAWIFVGIALLWSVIALGAAGLCRHSPAVPAVVLGTAIGVRLVLLAGPPTLSDDLYRYLWEGKIQWEGFNPFLHPPGHSDLSTLQDSISALVTYPDTPTIYPPLAQWLFALAALAYSPLVWKCMAGAADLGILFLLTRRARLRSLPAWPAICWALHPLPALESAGSGHLDSIALLLALAALYRHEQGKGLNAALWATAGGLVKILPLALLPAIMRTLKPREATRIAMACAAMTLAFCVPYLDAGPELVRGFTTYARHWNHNAFLFSGLTWVSGGNPLLARFLGLALGLCILRWAWVHRSEPAHFFLWTAGSLVLLSPVVHPWYVLWPLAASLWLGSWPWLVLATTCLLSYGVLQGYDPGGTWKEIPWIPWLEYPPFLLALWIRRPKHSTTSNSGDGSRSPSPTTPEASTSSQP